MNDVRQLVSEKMRSVRRRWRRLSSCKGDIGPVRERLRADLVSDVLSVTAHVNANSRKVASEARLKELSNRVR